MEKNIKFGDIEIQKQKLHQHKAPTAIKNMDINKIGISNKVSFGKKFFKYFIGYKDGKKNETFDETKYISFLIKDDELLEKYNEI